MSEFNLTDDDILRLTQGQRKKLLDHYTEKGIPSSIEEQEALMRLLADMDRTALGNKRVKTDEKLAGTNELVAQAITDVIKHFGGQNPFENNTTGVIIDAIPQPDTKLLPAANPVPGEMNIGIETHDFNDFVKKFED